MLNGVTPLFSILAVGTLALKASVDVETVLFAIQDIFTQGLLGYWLLLTHDSATGQYVTSDLCDERNKLTKGFLFLARTFHLDGFWSHGAGHEGGIRLSDEEGA